MTNLDFEASLKHIFMILHIGMLGGSAIYIAIGQNQIATFFAVSSVAALIYYVLYSVGEIHKRLEAHLNLIDEAIKDSEEFREGIRRNNEEQQKKSRKKELQKNLEEKSVDEATKWINEKLVDADFEEYENTTEFLEVLKEAEEESQDRLGIKNFILETRLDLEKNEVDEE